MRRINSGQRFSRFDWFLIIVIIVLAGIFLFSLVKRDEEPEEKKEMRQILEEEKNPEFREFGLSIPKLDIEAPVVRGVDSTDEEIYYKELEKGVAHYEGTALPGEGGNIFIFGHSSFLEDRPGEYKEIFKDLEDLEEGDEIFIWFEGEEHKYKVSENKIVEPVDFSVLESTESERLTLMTCYPPGTIDKRLIIIAE